MSGICGWFGGHAETDEDTRLINKITRPLASNHTYITKVLTGNNCSLAASGPSGTVHTYQEGPVLVALQGELHLKNSSAKYLQEHGNPAAAFYKAYSQQGSSALELLAGSFSLALINESTEEGMIAVDQLGISPLISYQLGSTLIFGSRADCIKAYPGVEKVVDPQAVYNYLYYHVVPTPQSIYHGFVRMTPGDWLEYKKGYTHTSAYWRPHYRDFDTRDFRDLRDEFREILHHSVKDTLLPQGTGAFLSGGTDSSTVTGMLREITGQAPNTYSIGFDAEGYDEMEYARIAAQKFGARHNEYYVTPADLVSAIPDIAASYDNPFGNSSAVPTYYCAKLAKEDGMDLLLGGDGGDELFGGNTRYAKQRIFSLYNRQPAILRKALIEPLLLSLPGTSSIPVIKKIRRYVEQARLPLAKRLESYNLLHRLGANNLFQEEYLGSVDMEQPEKMLSMLLDEVDAEDLPNKMMGADLKVTLTDNDLPKVTGMCELAGIRVRFPLLDYRLIAFSEHLPTILKLKGTKLRYFFKEALSDLLPQEIITKKKHGFGLPFGVWMQSDRALKEFTNDSLNNLKKRNIFKADFIDQLTSVHITEHAGYYGSMVWVLMMLEQWFQTHE